MNYESFRSHVYCKHRNTLHTVTSPILTAAEASDSLETETEPPEPFVTESVSQEIDLHNSGARFLLKARDYFSCLRSVSRSSSGKLLLKCSFKELKSISGSKFCLQRFHACLQRQFSLSCEYNQKQ